MPYETPVRLETFLLPKGASYVYPAFGRDRGRYLLERMGVRLNKRTETAMDRDDSEIGRFLCLSSSKKGLDIKTIFLAEKVGSYGFY